MASASCTADPGPAPTVTPKTTPTVTPTPDVTTRPEDQAPEPPPALTSADASGAETTARYAIDVLNRASATADVTEWSRITAPTCETCVGFADDITAAGPDDGGVITIESAKVNEIDPGAFSTVALVVSQEPYTSSDGTLKEGGRFAFLLALRFTDRWTIEALDVAGPDAPWAQ